LSLALREVERAAATAPRILLQCDRSLRFFHEFLEARITSQRIPDRIDRIGFCGMEGKSAAFFCAAI